jgi:hypothetical protein
LKRSGAFLVLSLLVLTGASVDNKKEIERVDCDVGVLRHVPALKRFLEVVYRMEQRAP